MPSIYQPWRGPTAKTPSIIAELQGFHSRVRGFLRGPAVEVLEHWRVEAEGNQDMPTASVVHFYKDLLWPNLRPEDYTPETVTALLTSLAYVHNWHGFDLGKWTPSGVGRGTAPCLIHASVRH